MNGMSLRKIMALAENGVDWDRGKGAKCPLCGARMKVQSTKNGIRYCRCRNTECLLGVLGLGVKAA